MKVINGELVEVEAVGDGHDNNDDNDEDQYEEAYLNRHQGIGMLRKARSYNNVSVNCLCLKKFIGRGSRKKEKSKKTKGLRNCAGSKDSKWCMNINMDTNCKGGTSQRGPNPVPILKSKN